jgi:hypothetical protein
MRDPLGTSRCVGASRSSAARCAHGTSENNASCQSISPRPRGDVDALQLFDERDPYRFRVGVALRFLLERDGAKPHTLYRFHAA